MNLYNKKSLTVLRKSVSTKRISSSTIILIILISIAFSIGAQNNPENMPNIIALVGRENITGNDLSEKIAEISEQEENYHLSYLQRRELALDLLIQEALLITYAKESGIEVTATELDNYFISQYGDHPRVTTNGVFDNGKYQALKRTPEIRSLLNDLRRFLIIHKTETIIKNRFNYSEEELTDLYFLDNTDIDLSYTLLKDEQLNSPFFVHPYEAYKFYERNRNAYHSLTEFKVEFFIVPFENFSAKASQSDMVAEDVESFLRNSNSEILFKLLRRLSRDYEKEPSLALEMNPSRLRSIIAEYDTLRVLNEVTQMLYQQTLEHLALQEAIAVTRRAKDNLHIDYPILSIRLSDYPYDDTNPQIFQRDTYLPNVKRTSKGSFSQPLIIDNGYVVFKVVAIIGQDETLPTRLASKIWSDFLEQESVTREEKGLRSLYQANLRDFIVPAAYTTKIVIDKNVIRNRNIPDRELRSFFQQNKDSFAVDSYRMFYEDLIEDVRREYLDNEVKKLREWSEANIYSIGYELQTITEKEYHPGLKASNSLIFLEKVPNRDKINDLISDTINANPDFQSVGFETDDEIIYYVINSYFPRFLPDFDDLNRYLYQEFIQQTITDTDVYRDYYEKNVSSFTSQDSLKLAGLFYPIEADIVSINERELRDYYDSRKDQLLTEHQTIIEYIRIYDPDIIKRELIADIKDWIKKDIKLPLLHSLFGIDYPLFNGNQSQANIDNNEKAGYHKTVNVSLNQLPQPIQQYISTLAIAETGNPIYFDNSWFIIRKIQDIPPKPATFNQMRRILTEQLKRKKAEEIAHRKAYRSFIDYARLVECFASEDSLYHFRTEMKSADSEFGPLGDISTYRSRLVNLRRNERLNTIYINEDGYGIVFLAEKREGIQLSFEKALPMVRDWYNAEYKAKNTQQYALQLRELIISGENPDSLLIFWGGWHKEYNLTLNDLIPGVQYSRLIIENASGRNAGEISHLIRNGDDGYLFYRLDRRRAVNMDSYARERDRFAFEVVERDFLRWVNDYKQRVGVEKF